MPLLLSQGHWVQTQWHSPSSFLPQGQEMRHRNPLLQDKNTAHRGEGTSKPNLKFSCSAA